MRDLPIVAKAILNVLLYVLYVIVFSVVFSVAFPLLMELFTGRVLNPSSPIFANIQYFIALLVLLISLILRKYFYIGGPEKQVTLKVEANNYTTKKKQVKAKKSVKKNQTKDENLVDDDDEEIKIYVEKEIK